MKFKKSTLLLIALFSVSVGYQHAQSDDDMTSTAEDTGGEVSDSSSCEGFEKIGGDGRSGSASSSSDSDNDSANGAGSPSPALSCSGSDSDDSGDDANAEWAPGNVNKPRPAPASNLGCDGTYPQPVRCPGFGQSWPKVGSDRDPYLSSSSQARRPTITIPACYSDTDEFDDNFSPKRNFHSRRNNGSCRMLGPVAAVFVVGYAFFKLFSGSKKTKNQRRVMPYQRRVERYSTR